MRSNPRCGFPLFFRRPSTVFFPVRGGKNLEFTPIRNVSLSNVNCDEILQSFNSYLTFSLFCRTPLKFRMRNWPGMEEGGWVGGKC